MFKSNIVLFWLSNKGNNLQAWSAQTVISYKQTLSSLTLVNNTLILISVRCFVSEAPRQKTEHHFWFNLLETNTHIILGKTSLIHGAGWTENSYNKHKAALVCCSLTQNVYTNNSCSVISCLRVCQWKSIQKLGSSNCSVTAHICNGGSVIRKAVITRFLLSHLSQGFTDHFFTFS